MNEHYNSKFHLHFSVFLILLTAHLFFMKNLMSFKAIHWRIPWIEETCGLQSIES